MSIRDLVASNHLEEALKALSGVDGMDSSEHILLTSRYNDAMRGYRMGTVSDSTHNMEMNRIRYAIIHFLEQAGGIKAISKNGNFNTQSNWVSATIDQMKELQRKVRFGFEDGLKSSANIILSALLTYESQTRRDDLYDANEKELDGLKQRVSEFVDSYQTVLRTKGKVKITEIKRMLLDLEMDFSRDTLKRLVSALISLDVKYAYLDDGLNRTQDFGLEDFASQVAEIVDSL